MNQTNKQQAGFSIIEVLFALVLLGTVLVGIAALMTRTLFVASEVRYREVANTLAQEVMEIYHKERTLLPWTTFTTDGVGTFCVKGSADSFYENNFWKVKDDPNNCDANTEITSSGLNFQRFVRATKDDPTNPTKVMVYVNVFWKTGRGGGTLEDSIETTQEFTNWF